MNRATVRIPANLTIGMERAMLDAVAMVLSPKDIRALYRAIVAEGAALDYTDCAHPDDDHLRISAIRSLIPPQEK